MCVDSDGEDVELSSPSSSACTTEDANNTWHTTAYYDYIRRQQFSTSPSRPRTAPAAGLPSVKAPVEDTASIIVEWDAIDEVSGRGVTHYEIAVVGETATSDWQQLWPVRRIRTPGTSTRTSEAGESFRYYRIRAVNDWDHKGPWSPPMTGTVEIPPPGQPTGLSANAAQQLGDPADVGHALGGDRRPGTSWRYASVLADCQFHDETLWASIGGSNPYDE